MPLNISLVQILDDHADGRAQDTHVAIPGTIVNWDHTKQTATVQPMVRKPLTSADGVLCFETPPQIPNVPVMCVRGGGFFVSVPLNAGDGVLLVFSEQSYSEWRSTGQISSPKDVRRHGTGYPYAIPGIAPDSQALGSVASDKLVIGRDGNEELITIGAGELQLGSGATNHPASGEANDANWTQMATALGDLATYLGEILPIAGPSSTATALIGTQLGAAVTAIQTTVGSLVTFK